ncbi:TetR family transcriptional regulator [Streptococcus sanguinis]|jgi:hypothetical protein|uniref:TetR family transcriptional regulator n=1 Tax=Streptococcus sanguinis TaxID=1305 RepID=UPI001D153C06|nr:TetR family transcriptional regulator [Streptococcus sanguinis]MCC3168256.1 hypothetical protein [Streptococcus sanguinis]
MSYFEERFQQIYEKFLFSLKIYSYDSSRREACYQDCLGEMDSLFLRHDTHDRFAKKLLDCKNTFQRKVKKAYLGI